MSDQARAELAPSGVLRAGINMANALLVTGRTADGDPDGVSPDMARAIAERLGVPLKLVPFNSPGELGDAVGANVWDIGLIGAEPQRAEKIEFTAAYAEIEATYLVPAGSSITTIEEVDRPGVRIATPGRSAYGLWLDRNIEHATLVRAGSGQDALQAVRRRQTGRAGRTSVRPRRARGGASRRAHPRRPLRNGAASRRHGEGQSRRRGLPAELRRGSQGIRPRHGPDRQTQGRGQTARSMRRRAAARTGGCCAVCCPPPRGQLQRATVVRAARKARQNQAHDPKSGDDSPISACRSDERVDAAGTGGGRRHRLRRDRGRGDGCARSSRIPIAKA